jgi:hypothetical protein
MIWLKLLFHPEIKQTRAPLMKAIIRIFLRVNNLSRIPRPRLDEPRLDEPGLDEPRLDEPRLDEPRLEPKLAFQLGILKLCL